jgi:hypothetical protein
MLSGFNTNYRYRGVLFHIQTEDSGVSNPHVITHLFHGGNILASEKLDYSTKLESEDLEGAVRELMESLHKAMLKGLQRGLHDATILERLGPTAFSDDTDPVFGSGFEGDASDTASTLPPDPSAPATPTVVVEPAGSDTPQERLNRVFGEGVVSQKPLDEVVLEYLVENARKRKRHSP